MGAGAGIEPAAPVNEAGMLPLHHPAKTAVYLPTAKGRRASQEDLTNVD